MKTETKIMASILIFIAILLAGAVFFLSGDQKTMSQGEGNQLTYKIDYSNGQKIGSDSAKIKLVEFSDFQCPACKGFEPFLKQALTDYKNDILFVYKHFPLPQHLNAKTAANMAEYAATEGKFWQMHDKLFETQEQWSALKDPTEFFIKLGKEIGLDETKSREAIEKSLYNNLISRHKDEGINLEVSATPTVFLNGVKLKLQKFSDLTQEIQKQL
ncbi:MAG: thioredoxin domain-containing protein [Candidatus Levyibacteriota bacterium]|nr:MAG: thioredoxin domain-containing protein [Candidatus Levybacteria bacterium]